MTFSFGIKSLFSPEDDIEGELLSLVRSARTSIHMAIYGFTLPSLTDELIAAKRRGVEVRGLFDLSQSQGHFEREQLERLRSAGVTVLVGTSPKEHAILHEKFLCVDALRTASGSFNYSRSAKNQTNHTDLVYSKERAAWFLEHFERIWAAVLTQQRPQATGDANGVQ